MTGAKKVRDFTVGPILPQIIKFAVPLMITGVMQLLFNTADTIVVGRWGGETPEECETALAAVGSCGSLINLITLLFMNISLGSGVCVAQDIGSRDYDGIRKIVRTSVTFSLITSVFVMIFGFFAARPLLALMGTEVSVLDQAVPYMIAYFCGIPAKMLYNYCAAILRSAGETVRPMRYLFVAGIVNVVFNLVAVIVFDAGALGVGIATAASFWVSCVLIVIHMIKSDAPYHLDIHDLGINGDKLKKMLKIGIPAGIQGVVFSSSHVVVQSSINSLGKAVVAGNAAAANLGGYVYTPMTSFYQAVITFVGQHKGAKKYDRMKKCILCCMACVTVTGLILGLGMFAAAPYLLELYVPDNAEAIAAAMTYMLIVVSIYFLCGLMEVGSGVMRGFGRSTTSMVTSLLGAVVFRILWISIVFTRFPSLEIIYLSQPIAWVITSGAHYTLSVIVLRKEARQAKLEESADTEAKPVQ